MLSYFFLGMESLKYFFFLFIGNVGMGVIELEGCEYFFFGLGKGVCVSFINLR